MKILVIEDDARMRSFITKGLLEHGFLVDTAAEGGDGLLQLLTRSPDAVVVDIMMPVMDGITLVRRARQAGKKTPILFLSARSPVEDRVAGLRAGGDDYLVKPFSFSELLARLEALIRRAHDSPTDERSLRVADVEMDTHRRRVSRAGTEIQLQPLEFTLLEYLMRNAGRVVSKTSVMEHVWNYNFDPQTNVVEARVCRLRQKLEKPFSSKLIHTVRGCGYVLEER